MTNKPLTELLAETKAIVEARIHFHAKAAAQSDVGSEALMTFDAYKVKALVEALTLAVEQRNRFACNYNLEPFDDAIAPFDQALADKLRGKAGDR